jgi:hypothetical protein
VARISACIFEKIPVNSRRSKRWFVGMLAGFGFQKMKNPALIFYKYQTNFPKLFLRKNVEKKGNAMRVGFSIAYPQSVNI